MNTYKIIVRCKSRETITMYANAYTHTEAQALVERLVKRAFVRITTVRIA